MSRDQGPQDTLTTGNGGNVITDGECLPRDQPQPTDGGDWYHVSRGAVWLVMAGVFTAISIIVGLLMASFIRSIT